VSVEVNDHFSNADIAIVFGINHSELLLENELAVIANGATGAFRVVDDAVTVGIASKSLRLLRVLLDPLDDQDLLGCGSFGSFGELVVRYIIRVMMHSIRANLSRQ